jgi:hypothetical protein
MSYWRGRVDPTKVAEVEAGKPPRAATVEPVVYPGGEQCRYAWTTGRGPGDPADTALRRNNICPGVLNLKGESFRCDMVAPHDGWGHANKVAQAIWGEGAPNAILDGNQP